MPRLPRRSTPIHFLTRVSGVLCAASLLLTAGCGGGSAEAAHQTGSVRRVTFRPLDGGELDTTIRSIGVIELPEEAEDWEPIGDGLRITEATDARGRGLVLRGDRQRGVRVPLAADTKPFNLVAVEATLPVGSSVLVQLGSNGKARAGSKGIWVAASPDPQVVLLEVPQGSLPAGTYDDLRVIVHSEGRLSVLHRVELLERPFATFLPDAAAGPAPFELEFTQARRAVGLSSERPLETLANVPKGAVLRFSVGLPQNLRLPGITPRELRVVLSDEAGRQQGEERLPLAWDKSIESWTDHEVCLAAVAGGTGRLRLELIATGKSEALLAVAEARVVVPGKSPPTVFFLTSDTHRYDHLASSDRGVDVRTTNLDALAERGALFSNCFTSANSTNPSHVALLTGRHPRDTGILNNTTPIADDAPTLASRFAEAGYTTIAALSARHLGHDTSGLGAGFDRMTRPRLSLRRSDETIDELLEWTAELSDEPLFVWLHVFDAHTPYQPPPEHLARHWPDNRDPFDPRLPELEGVPQSIFGSGGVYEGLRDLEYPLAKYRAEVESLDEELARVLDHPRLGRGVFAFTADHGELLGHHGCYYNHAGVYPDSIHVPLILTWPGGPAGVRVERPVTHLDIGRTLLDLAGHPDVTFPGANLVAPLLGAAEPPPAPRFALAAHGLSTSITWGEWHLVLNIVLNGPHSDPGTPVRQAHQVELYQLERDPACKTDLVDEHPEVARRLREQLLHWLTNPEPTGWARTARADEDTAAQLAELGYTADSLGQAPQEVRWEPDDCDWCRRFQ